VVGVPGYRSRGPGFDSRLYHFLLEVMGLERGLLSLVITIDRLCGLVVRVSGYSSRGAGFDSRRYQTLLEVVGLKRGPLSLVITIDRLCGLVVRVPGYRSRGSDSIPCTTRFSEK
jgi:hypothetical protein